MCRSVLKMTYSSPLLFLVLVLLGWQDPSLFRHSSTTTIICHASTVASGGTRRRNRGYGLSIIFTDSTTRTTATRTKAASKDPIAFLCKRQQTPSSSLTFHDDYHDANNNDDNDKRQLLSNDNDESKLIIQNQKSRLLLATAATEKQEKQGSPFWPPWPFNLMKQKRNYETTTRTSSSSQQQLGESNIASNNQANAYSRRTVSSSSFSAASLIWTFGYQTVRVSFKNMQELGSQLWFHLPPATPPFLLLASIPQRSSTAATATTKMILPIWSDPFVRNVVVSSLGLAIMSWAHSELTRRRKLTLLPLSSQYIDMNRVILPPFLPEAVPTPFLNDIQQEEDDDDDDDEDDNDDDDDENSRQARRRKRPVLPSRLQRHWKQLRGKVPKPRSLSSAIRDWKNMRLVQKSERKNAHRLLIYDELLAIQTLKKKADQRHEHHHHHQNKKSGPGNSFSSSQSSSGKNTTKSSQHITNELGYALVTGASQGIGRAIAVELARWEIPLILVARNVDALIELAYDIEACYGVPCCVLQADLAKPETAQAIYQTVKDAGLPVDILVNNAGVSSQGQSLRMSLDEINRMIQVNAISVSTLTHLFGRDMKERRRGRILMVSSICGAVSGIASVAVYSATKAFENSFGISIGKELEPYGVGVTCLLPGAVRDTEFRARSNSAEALCWKLPFYAKTAPFVAHMGVRAMLRGETEVTPGVMNRIFLKVVKPVLPQRIHNLIAEVAWSPLSMPWEKKRYAGDWEDTHSVSSFVDEAQPTHKHVAKPVRPQAYGYRELPPRILKLPEPKPDPVLLPIREVITETVESNATVSMETDESNGSDVTIIEKEPTVLPQNTITTLQSLPESPSVPTHQVPGGQDDIPKASSPLAQERVEEAEKPNIQRTRTQLNNDARETRKIPKQIREKPAKNDEQKLKQTQESTTADDSLKPVQRLEEILNRATSGSEFYVPSIHPTEKQGLICDRVTGICN